MQIAPATIEDAADILALQHSTYREVAERYDDFSIPPLTEGLEDLRNQFGHQQFLKVCLGGQIVGVVRACQEGDTCYIGRLIVAPAYQRQGIGTALLLSVEGAFPKVQQFELFTGHKSAETLKLYTHLGYEEVGREVVSEKLTHIVLRKDNSERAW